MQPLVLNTTPRNTISYFIDGKSIYPKIIEMIKSASKSVYVEVFLFYNDESGNGIIDALIEKADAGLDVRVLVSEKGTEFNKSTAIYKKFKEHNIKFVPTFPLPKLVKDFWKLFEWTSEPKEEREDEDKGESLRLNLDESIQTKISQKSKAIKDRLYKQCEKDKTRDSNSFLMKLQHGKILRSLTFYDHRKIIIVDNEKAFMGGMNFGNDYLFQGAASELGYFHDIGIWVEGDAVKDVLMMYLQIWQLFSGETATFSLPKKESLQSDSKEVSLTTLSSFPRKFPNEIRKSYFNAVMNAKDYIYIINLYLTDSGLLHELKEARKRGVDVHLVSTFIPTPGIKSWFVRQLYKGYFYLIFHKEKLQDHGVHLHHYTKYNVHAKVGMVDNNWVTIGSSNLDYSSLRNAMEINVSLTDSEFIKTLKKNLFDIDFKESGTLDKKLPFFKRIYYFICYCTFMVAEKYFI